MARKKTGSRKRVRPREEPEPERRPRSSSVVSSGSNVVGLYVNWILRGVVFGALALAASIIIGRYNKANEAAEKWEASLQAYNNQDYDKAIRLINEAKKAAPPESANWNQMDKFPKQIAVFYLAKAVKHNSAGEWDHAATSYAAVCKYDPEVAAQAGYHMKAASCFERAGNFTAAVSMARKALKTNRRNVAEKFLERLKKNGH